MITFHLFKHGVSLELSYYPTLSFFGGLASVCPGTSTVESGILVIGYEKDDSRMALTNFYLKASCNGSNLTFRIK